MITEDGEGVGRHGASRHVDHGRSQLPGDLVHVGQRQEKTLGGGEGRAQRPGAERAVDGPGRARLALHLDDIRNNTPQVGPSLMGPRIGQFTHRRGWCDRIDRDHLTEEMSDPGGGLVAIDHCAVARGEIRHGDDATRTAIALKGPMAPIGGPFWPRSAKSTPGSE